MAVSGIAITWRKGSKDEDSHSRRRPVGRGFFKKMAASIPAFSTFLQDYPASRKRKAAGGSGKETRSKKTMDRYVQDGICDTWELFRDVIGETSEDKVEWAKTMGTHLTTVWRGTRANKSNSFCQFCEGLLRLAGEVTD